MTSKTTGIIDYPVKVGPGDTRIVKAIAKPDGSIRILPPKRRITAGAPVVNTTIGNPRILKTTAAVSRNLVLPAAKAGDPEPYVYGHGMLRPKIIGADDSGEYLVLDCLWSVGEIDSIAGIPQVGWTHVIYMPDIGYKQVDNSSLYEHFTGTSGQSASTILTALKGSYAAYANKAHSVLSMQTGWNLNLMGAIYGRKILDPRNSPNVRTFSQNPALVLADILALCGYTVDQTSLAGAADYCDELTGSLSPQHKRWEIFADIRTRHDLLYWTHTLAQYANCFVDVVGGDGIILTPDKPRSANHTVTASNMIDGSVRVSHKSARDKPEQVIITMEYFGGLRHSHVYGTSSGAGTVTQLDMPYWRRGWCAERKAEEVYRKSQASLSLEYLSFDDGLLRTIGDVGTITNADYGLTAQDMILVENEPVDRGRWRRKYIEYDATHYVESDSGEPTFNDVSLNNPYNPPDGPTPTLTAELVTSTSPNYYRIKIEFSPVTWAYLQDYKVNVYVDGVPGTILHSEYVAKGSETGSPETITVYADLSDSPGFQMAIGTSPQTVYRVDVYNRSLWTNQDGTEVLSATPGTATVTDPVAVYWNDNPLATFELVEYANTATPSILFSGTDATTGTSSFRWDYSSQAKIIEPLIAGTFTSGEYVVMYDNVVEIYGNDSSTFLQINGSSNPGVWFDALGAEIRILDQSANSPQQKGQVYSCDIHFAQDDGAGAPLAGTTVTKSVTLIAWGAENWYSDLFTDTNGTLLENHTPTDPAAVSPSGWEILSGSFEISSNRAISSGASPLVTASACIDMGDTDVAWRGFVLVSGSTGDDVALIGRVQDANNYWQLKLTDTDTANPVLTLNEVSGGTPTSRATVTMTGKGPLSDSTTQLMRLTFSGNSILGAICIRGTGDTQYISDGTSPDAVWTVSYTSASFNTETKYGIQCFQDNASWDSVFASMVEPDYLSYIDNYVQGP